MTTSTLILLAGTSEAGKSTAGCYLAARGARRLKIRSLLLRLASGELVEHEGVATRQGFDPCEFLALLRETAQATLQPVIVVESFIDAQLARLVKETWPATCVLVFITATRDVRTARLAAATGASDRRAVSIVRTKDQRKKVDAQLPLWRLLADRWIDNDGTLDDYRQDLALIAAQVGLDTTTETTS